MGGKGTTQNTKKFTEHGASLITEADFLGMILAQGNANKENAHLATGTANKRPLEDASSGPSKPSKAARKSEASAPKEEEDMKWLHYFLMERQNEVRLEGKTLTAFDCGGQVYKAQRGKSCVELLRKFNKFLEDCKGVSFSYLFFRLKHSSDERVSRNIIITSIETLQNPAWLSR